MAALPQIAVPNLVGTYRTFGPDGPLYEVLHYAGRLKEGVQLVSVRVVDTGECLDYRIDRLLADPEAQ